PPTRPGSLGRLGHYEVLEVLGNGGFGTVFKAFDDRLLRLVAVKMLAPEHAACANARLRFLREARITAQVRHEHVATIFGVEADPVPFLVMDYVPGETLERRLEQRGPFPAAELVRVGRQIALGLEAAHRKGLIHRDIKPANIILEAGT